MIHLLLSYSFLSAPLWMPSYVSCWAPALQGDEETASSGLDSDALQVALQAELERTLAADPNVPGISIGITLPDGRVVAACAGFADREEQVPMTTQHRLMSGSNGKTYVAALAMALAQEEVILLDEPLSVYLGDEGWFPHLPNGEAGATLRQHLMHTSGVPEYYSLPAFPAAVAKEPSRDWSPLDTVEFILDREAHFAPGEGWSYADTNFILVGMALEEATGKKVTAMIAERFLTPLGLKDTIPNDRQELPGLAAGYRSADNPLGLPEVKTVKAGRYIVNPEFEWCGGGYLTTPSDLSRWMKALYSGAALDGEYVQEMTTGVPARTGRGHKYGLGTQLIPLPIGMLQGHEGFFPGYLTSAGYFADLRVGIAVQINSSQFEKLRTRPRAVVQSAMEIVKRALDK